MESNAKVLKLLGFLSRPARRRSFAHWSSRYVINRAAVMLHQRRHPDIPWITAAAFTLLSGLLRPTDRGLEYGAGRSTAWLAANTASLISVEHDPRWQQRVAARLMVDGLTNVTCHLVRAEPALMWGPAHDAYVAADASLLPGAIDYALVDGLFRDECALRAAALLAPGGLLILDNANWYLPHATRSPNSARVPASQQWAEFAALTSSWRRIWTSNGVWDTALWFKPNTGQTQA